MKKRYLIFIIIIGAIFLFFLKSYKDYNTSRNLYKEFRNTYNSYIGGISEDDVFVYLNEEPITSKNIFYYHSISSIEHEYYGSESSIEDSVANAILDSMYTQIILNNYNKNINPSDLEDIINSLKIQYEKGSSLVSTTSKIRLDYPNESKLWVEGKYALNYLEDEIMRNNKNIKKEDMGRVILNEIFDLSKGYKIKLTPRFYEYCDKKIFEDKLKEYNFVFSD